MKTLEKILIIGGVASIIIKTLHFTGNSFLTITLMSLIALVYLLFGFYLFNDKSNYNLGKRATMGLIHSILAFSMLFKLQSWPYATMLIASAFIVSLILLVIIIQIKGLTIKEPIIKRLLVVLVIAATLFLVPTKDSNDKSMSSEKHEMTTYEN